MKKTPAGSLKKALTILKAFSFESPRLRIKEISEITGINQASVHRLLNEMKEFKFIEQQKDGSYALGMSFVELAGIMLYSMEVRQCALPYLEELAKKAKAAANLGVLDGYEVIYIARFENPEAWVYFHLGMRRPAYCTALGKVLLSSLSEAEIIENYRKGIKRYTSNKRVTEDEFLKEIEGVRLQGYATDFEVFSRGINCVATPVFNAAGEIAAAISISGTTNTFAVERAMDSVPLLFETAQKISGRLGYTQGFSRVKNSLA